jgi:hypothetical protein
MHAAAATNYLEQQRAQKWTEIANNHQHFSPLIKCKSCSLLLLLLPLPVGH